MPTHRPRTSRARAVFDRIDRISRRRALTDVESQGLEDAMRDLGMIA